MVVYVFVQTLTKVTSMNIRKTCTSWLQGVLLLPLLPFLLWCSDDGRKNTRTLTPWWIADCVLQVLRSRLITTRYDISIWYDMIRYDTIWYDTIWYSIIYFQEFKGAASRVARAWARESVWLWKQWLLPSGYQEEWGDSCVLLVGRGLPIVKFIIQRQ